MNTTKRQNGLYSTSAAGAATLFNGLDDAAFASGGAPTVAEIKAYTLDPSYSGGTYLAGRKNGSFLGTISRGNDLALTTQMVNMPLYLADASYRSFFSGTVSSRPELVLVGSDDGFLYAFNQTDGELKWGWIPRTLVQELQHYNGFQDSHYQRGKIDAIDAKDGSGNYATYVAGAYKDGRGHYVLKLTAAGGLASVVWDEDRSAGFAASPNHGEMAYFQDGSGTTYVAYVVTTNAGLSTLVLRSITDAAVKTEVALDFNATSTPFILPDFDDADAPAARTLYLGREDGTIRRATLLSAGVLRSAADLQTDLQGASVGDIGGADASKAIRFLGVAASNKDHKYYLRAQSDVRLTVSRYDSASTLWKKRWTSYRTGAGSWNDDESVFTPDASGAPTDTDGDGVYTNVTANGIQSLPAGASLTDTAQIFADAVILPVTVPVTGNCYSRAFYYLYRLTDGQYPDDTFYRVGGAVITEDLFLGFGEATRVQVSDMPSKEKLVGYGHADQKPDNSTGVTSSFLINDPVTTGIRGWKELRR